MVFIFLLKKVLIVYLINKNLIMNKIIVNHYLISASNLFQSVLRDGEDITDLLLLEASDPIGCDPNVTIATEDIFEYDPDFIPTVSYHFVLMLNHCNDICCVV